MRGINESFHTIQINHSSFRSNESNNGAISATISININIYSIISPLLSLFDVNLYYNKYNTLSNEYMISLISSLCIICNHIPYSLLKGVDNQLQLKEAKDSNKYYINYKHLFG